MSIRLGRGAAVGGAVVGTAALSLLGANLAGAQEPPLESISVVPDSGAPGDSFEVSGGGCTGAQVIVSLLEGDDTLTTATATPEEGAWSATLTVPDEEFADGTQLAVTANCIGSDVEYEDGFFTVVVDEEPPTSSTSSTTSTTQQPPVTQPPGDPGQPPADQPSPTTSTTVQPPAGPPSPVPQAPPARPVTGRPSFTG